MTRSEYKKALLVMASMLLYAALGYCLPYVPAWKMYTTMPRYTYKAWDRNGDLFNIRDFVPERAYLIVSPLYVTWIAGWYLERHPDKAPLTIELKTWSRTNTKSEKLTVNSKGHVTRQASHNEI